MEIAKYYNENVKKAINTYREKNREKYNEYCSSYLKKKLEDTEWTQARYEKMAKYSREYYQKKREEKIANGYVPNPRGRPKKVVQEDLGEN